MKRPSFQFYPGDWQSDLKLRRCSPAARGVWMDILCAMHDSDDGYGLLRWPLREIARTVGAALAHANELVYKGVLRGSDTEITEAFVYVPRSGRKDGAPVTLIATQPGPLWYSKRLVKDEHVRTIRGESTRFGDDNKPSPKPPKGDGTSSSSSSPTSLPEANASGKARKRAAAPKVPPRPDDVSEQVWDDWVAHRRKKRATVTATVIDGARAEAAKAGMALEAFLRVWCTRGTQGLQAEWLTPEERSGAPPPRNGHTAADRRLATVRGLTTHSSTQHHDPRPEPPPADIVDIAARAVG